MANKGTHTLHTSLGVCGAAITELDPGGRDSLANTVGWIKNISMCAPLNSTDVLLICLPTTLHSLQ